MSLDRIRLASLHDKVMSAEQAASFIENDMTVGMSGFTRAGEAKAVPQALAERAKKNPLKITLITGASLGNDLDKQLTEAGVLARRMPFQVDNTLRRAINNGEVMFVDQHLSETVEHMRNLQLKKPDIAVIEAVAITEDGGIIPTTSVGNSASFAIFAEKVIVEINTNTSTAFEGLHDIYIPTYRPTRQPIPLTKVDERMGSTAINIDPAKIVGIVFNDTLLDSPSTVTPPDDETQGIANHLIAFFEKEVAEGRLPKNLGPLQAGIGSIAKGGDISSIVPMVSHVDHNEHDVDILVTEIGLADLRGLAPRERAKVIIENCVHPLYRNALQDYFERACERGGHTPHLLREALSWHANFEETGHMLVSNIEVAKSA